MEEKKLPNLNSDKGLPKEILEPEVMQESCGCKHEFELKGYEAVCRLCSLGLFVKSYGDFVELTNRMKKVQ